MKKGIVLNFKKLGILNYVTQNKIFILLCGFFVFGILISGFLLSDDSFVFTDAKTFLNYYLSLHKNNLFLNKFCTCFLRYIVVLFIYFLSATSIFGIIITPFFTVWQGIMLGAFSSQLYSLYGIEGIAYNAIIIIPPAVLFTVSCFFAAKYSIDFSFLIAKLTLPRSKSYNLYVYFKKLCSKYLILITIIVFCVLIEISLNLLFLKFFNI